MPFQATSAHRELFEMSVDGLPTPNTIIVRYILEKYVRVKYRCKTQAVFRATPCFRRFRESVRLH